MKDRKPFLPYSYGSDRKDWGCEHCGEKENYITTDTDYDGVDIGIKGLTESTIFCYSCNQVGELINKGEVVK